MFLHTFILEGLCSEEGLGDFLEEVLKSNPIWLETSQFVGILAMFSFLKTKVIVYFHSVLFKFLLFYPYAVLSLYFLWPH